MKTYILLLVISLWSINSFSYNIFVNPSSGNDANNGTINFPIKSLNRAGQLANGSDTVFIRGGHYYGFQNEFTRYNYQNAGKIVIVPYYNENVILDGSGYNFYDWQGILNIQGSTNIEIYNLEIRNNNSGCGIRVVSDNVISRFVKIRNCKISNTWKQGILIQGKNIIVDSCEISNAVLRNTNQSSTSWDAALQTYLYPLSLNYCDSIIFNNNNIYNSWGEGIVLVRSQYFLVDNNKVHDCYSGYIYVDNSYNGTIRNNWVYSTNNIYNRTYPSGYSAPGVGIFIAAEGNSYVNDRIVENINIYNNIVVRTGPAFGWWNDTNNPYSNNSYRNINIYYNTVFKTIGYQSFYLDENISPNRVPPSGCNFRNNIICKARYNNTVNSYFTASPDYNNPSIWNIKNNCFIDGFPPNFQQNNIQGYPNFVD